jgi:hypothetical protein
MTTEELEVLALRELGPRRSGPSVGKPEDSRTLRMLRRSARSWFSQRENRHLSILLMAGAIPGSTRRDMGSDFRWPWIE